MGSFRIGIIAVAPVTQAGSSVMKIRIHLSIIKPEGDIDTFDLPDMVFILKDLWKKQLPGQMLFQRSLCRLFVQLKGDQAVRAQGA